MSKLNKSPSAATPKDDGQKNLGLFSLTALVVGSIIGSGVFALMNNMAAASGLMGILLGWLVTGIGMTFLVLTFRNLNKKKPKLEAGIYSYASAGFGRFMGFSSAWGYWISAWIGNVAYATMAFAALSYFFDIFKGVNGISKDGQNLASIIGASIILWIVQILIMRGAKSASFMNAIVTVAKIFPIAIFIFAIFVAFKINLFTADIWGSSDLGSLFNQMKGTMLVTVWAFIGIEGAVIFSGRAKKHADVAKASLLGLYTVLAIYVLVTVLSLGVMSQPDLAASGGMADVLKKVVGDWGAVLVNIGIIISILGAWLAWTLFAIELPYRAAKDGTFPAFFAKTNKKGVPIVALTITTLLIQAFLFTFLIVKDSAYKFTFSLATTTILIPYLLTALYQLKISIQEKSGTKGRIFNIIVGVVAAIYGGWLVYASGINYLLVTSIIYGAGVVVYVITRILKGKKPLTAIELVIAAVFVVAAIYAIQQLATGAISI